MEVATAYDTEDMRGPGRRERPAHCLSDRYSYGHPYDVTGERVDLRSYLEAPAR